MFIITAFIRLAVWHFVYIIFKKMVCIIKIVLVSLIFGHRCGQNVEFGQTLTMLNRLNRT